jgi:hypothetical protein
MTDNFSNWLRERNVIDKLKNVTVVNNPKSEEASPTPTQPEPARPSRDLVAETLMLGRVIDKVVATHPNVSSYKK